MASPRQSFLMDLKTQRWCLHITAAGLFAGAAGILAWSLADIENEVRVNAAASSVTPPSPAGSDDAERNGDASLASRLLRQALYDPPPPPVQPTPPPAPKVVRPVPTAEPKPEVTLVGTIIEPEQRLAIVADATGEFDVKGIGEALELTPAGMTIVQIDSEQITLRYQGRQSTIELDRSAKDTGGAAGNRGGGRRRNNR